MIRIASMWASILAGVIAALICVPAVFVATEWVLSVYDQRFPVATAVTTREPSPPGEVQFTMVTTKHRDCTILRVSAYQRGSGEAFNRVNVQKMSGGIIDSIPAGKTVASTMWRVWPTEPEGMVTIYVEHDCGDRLVRTKLAEIEV
jgi:hypothetical protein